MVFSREATFICMLRRNGFDERKRNRFLPGVLTHMSSNSLCTSSPEGRE